MTPAETHTLTATNGGLALGIALTVLGSAFMAVGSVVMKIGINEERPPGDPTPWEQTPSGLSPLKSPTWWFGLGIYSWGALLHVGGLAFAPASVLAPLNAFGLVANAIAAVLLLGERISPTESACTGLTVFGVVLCSIASFLHTENEAGFVDGTDSWSDPPYLVYFASCGICLFGSILAINALENRAHDQRVEELFQAHVLHGHIELTTRPQQQLQELLAKNHSNLSLETLCIGLLYSTSSGVVGAQFVLQLKEITNLMLLPSVWTSPQLYFSSLIAAIAILLQMHFLNMALGRTEATVAIPAYYVSWTLFGTLGGWAKYHEISGFTIPQFAVFAVGLVLTLSSIVLLAFASGKSSATETSAPQEDQKKKKAAAALNLGVPLAVALSRKQQPFYYHRFHTMTGLNNNNNTSRLTRSFTAPRPEAETGAIIATSAAAVSGVAAAAVAAAVHHNNNWTFHSYPDGGGFYSPVPPPPPTASSSSSGRKKPKSLAVISY